MREAASSRRLQHNYTYTAITGNGNCICDYAERGKVALVETRKRRRVRRVWFD